ncbi:hypothetical protein ACEN88_02555 [Massilia sp. CT11-108]|uniref:hypothetical protein n=1 Tax=Massilia sp. CT11-108 TaxID=3393900 RepID=UPI0039A5A180
MIFLGIALLMLLYVARKGVDFFFLAASTCVVYFYPVLFLEKIVFISEGIYSIDVDNGARVSLVCGIVYLLVVGYRSRTMRWQSAGEMSAKNLRFLKIQGGLLAAVIGMLMVLIVAQNGFGLSGRDKSEVMESLGYAYKIFSLLTSILIVLAFLLRERGLFIVAIAAVGLDLMFGFRSSLATLIAAYFLTRPRMVGWKSVCYLLLGFACALLMIVAKETAYFSKNAVDVLYGFAQSFDSDGLDFLSFVNPESATISAVYNEIVKSDFSASPVYLLDSFVALFPFTNLIGYEAIGFDTYFKGIVFGAEGNSFASGMLSVGYGLGGYFGVALCFALIGCLGRIFNRVVERGEFLNRAIVIAVAGIMLTSFYRSDLIYLVGIVRSLVVILILLKTLGIVMRVLAMRPAPSSSAGS